MYLSSADSGDGAADVRHPLVALVGRGYPRKVRALPKPASMGGEGAPKCDHG